MLPLLFVSGILGQGAILAYPWLATRFGEAQSGRARTAAAFAIIGAAFSLQYAIGATIELFPAAASGGYPPHSYQVAFGVTMLSQLLVLAWYFLNLRLLNTASAP